MVASAPPGSLPRASGEVAASASAGTPAPTAAVGPAAPASVSAALPAALADFYYHSGRLVLANAAWGVCLVAVLGLALFVAPIALALLPAAAVPAAGIARMAGAIVRGGEFVDARQFRSGVRRRRVAALAAGMLASATSLVLVVNVVTGASQGGAAGWAFATLAAWGLAAAWTWMFAWWPLLGDPARDAVRATDLARLAAAIVLVRPARMLAGAAVVGVLVAASAALVIVLAGTGVAYASLVAAHIVLPVADRMEDRGVVTG